MAKKIALIIERSTIALGGGERSVFEMSLALSAIGYRVHILAAKGRTNAKHIHILCSNTPGKRTGYFTFAKALKKHFAQNQYDIIHSVLPYDFADVYQPRGGAYVESIIRNAASFQNKFVETYKKVTAFANFHRTALLRAEKQICKDPNGPIVAVLSKYMAEQFRRHYNLNDDRIALIPNGIKSVKQYQPEGADKLRSQILAHLNITESQNPALFLFVANNFRLKGLVPLMKAFRIVLQNQTPRSAYLVIAGHGSSHKYRLLARSLKIHKRIIFLGGIRHIQDALSIIDTAVLPTFYDPSSRFILEALSAGKPVITTAFNGASDMFIDDRHGKIIDEPGNVAALAEAIRYYTDPENVNKASQAIIHDKLEESISITRVATQLSSLYDSILEKKGRL
ncbi:MAG: glycosyltransferase family 1 protein [Candidatus Brocadiia bacterium]|nr:MAG: glycosyltransferase family 1 protein [Candidatus Brocadiia bacterium]